MLSTFKVKFELNSVIFRGLINGKEGKAAALPKFLDMLTLSQPEGGGRHIMPTHWVCYFFYNYAPDVLLFRKSEILHYKVLVCNTPLL